jgi:hypothetical protein
MTIDQFLASLRTASEYRTTALYLQWWQRDAKHYPSFADYLGTLELAHNTIAKHIRHARTLCKRCNLNYAIDPVPSVYVDPPKFTDDDF